MLLDQFCYPGFPNMNELFCILGFRCLSRYQFLEYVEACVFDIRCNFVERVFKDIIDTPENIQTKLQLVTYLPKEIAHSIIKGWNHAIGNRYLMQQIKIPSEILHYNMNISEMENEDFVQNEDFVPLRSLLRSH